MELRAHFCNPRNCFPAPCQRDICALRGRRSQQGNTVSALMILLTNLPRKAQLIPSALITSSDVCRLGMKKAVGCVYRVRARARSGAAQHARWCCPPSQALAGPTAKTTENNAGLSSDLWISLVRASLRQMKQKHAEADPFC